MTRPYSDDEIRDMLTWAKSFPEKPEAQAILRWGATVTHWKANHADAVEKKRRGEEVKQGIIDEVQRENDGLRDRLRALLALKDDATSLGAESVTTMGLTSWVYEAKGFIKRVRDMLLEIR